MKYLDPKADLTFKKVFGEHKDLVISFLNAMLPFESAEEEVKWVEYLSPEMVPVNPLRKDSVVDVRCRDGRGRQFLVEMQMMWTSEYKQRVLFNASKAYVSQLGRSENFELLQPVYSLNLVNDTFSDSKDYYHDYRIVAVAETEEVIEGLRFIFVELPKFTPKSYSDKKMQVLWLRYLTEIDEKTKEAPEELLETPEINKALSELEESAFSENELLVYDRFWDIVRTSRMFIDGAARDGERRGFAKGMKEGMKEGMEEGMKEGMKQGMEQGRKEGKKEGIEQGVKQGIEKGFKIMAGRLKSEGLAVDAIAKLTGLSQEEIKAL